MNTQTVYIGHDKNGPLIFSSPLAVVRYRLSTTYQYAGDLVHTQALRIAANGTERAAWVFLNSRRDHEYEGVDVQKVIE